MNLEEQQQLARDLYYQERYTQKQIGEIIGVSQKTICMWVKDKKWEYLKNSVDQTPLYMIASINRELTEINNRIANRDGRKIPYQEEANLRYKLLSTIKLIQSKQDLGSNMEVLANFIAFIKEQGNTNLAKEVLAAADEYLTGSDNKRRKKITIPAYKPIPGQEHYLPIPIEPEPEPEIVDDIVDDSPEEDNGIDNNINRQEPSTSPEHAQESNTIQPIINQDTTEPSPTIEPTTQSYTNETNNNESPHPEVIPLTTEPLQQASYTDTYPQQNYHQPYPETNYIDTNNLTNHTALTDLNPPQTDIRV